MALNLILILGLLFPAWLQESSSVQSQAVRFHRFENFVGPYNLEESMIDLGEMARKSDATVVVRICSTEPLVKSAFMAAAVPGVAYSYSTGIYNVAPERVLLSRSEDCLSNNPDYAATELWVVPKGAAAPPSVESISLCQLKSESMMPRGEIRSARQFRIALRRMVNILRANPKAVGIINGSYHERPSLSMQNRLGEARRLFQQSGLSADRYLVRLGFMYGEWSEGDPEPKYPNLFAVETTRKCQ
jgi:hypothetical protein